MGKRRSHKTLAEGLSGNDVPCPIPATHDKLLESHYFLHQMEATYHEPADFRFNMHAFLQSTKSIFEVANLETQNDARYIRFRSQLKELQDASTMKVLLGLRNDAAHKASLVANAHIQLGWFKNGRLKSALHFQPNPLQSSLQLMMRIRNSSLFVAPRRQWCAEECGVRREWHLPEFDGELVREFHDAWKACSIVVDSAHSCMDSRLSDKDNCVIDYERMQTVLEHEHFPEVEDAWDGEPTNILVAKRATTLFEYPSSTSNHLFTLTAGATVLCWANLGTTWGESYSSALICQIDGKDILANTAIFFEDRDFQRKLVEQPSAEA